MPPRALTSPTLLSQRERREKDERPAYGQVQGWNL